MKHMDKPAFERYQKAGFWANYWVEITIILIGLVAINLIFIVKLVFGQDVFDPNEIGPIGDFIGGYIGTVLGLISVVLIYSSFKEQRLSSESEKFQNKYFELIKMHRENVAEIKVGEDSGKKVFMIMVREFREIYKIASELSLAKKSGFTNEDLFRISYCALYYGVGPNSSRMLLEGLKGYDLSYVLDLEKKLNDEDTKLLVMKERHFKFRPFEGHQSRLGHYYRHLYQTVCFVDNQEIDIDKYEYIKTIRAQLTTHEQALLFISSLSPLGKNWWNKNLLVKYRLLKNIPIGFFDPASEIDFESYFPEKYFEWQENRNEI
jgi:hypothetical protein